MSLMQLLKTDFHMHTKDDPQDRRKIRHSAEQLIDHAAKCGFEVLAITNHDKITYSPYLREYAAIRGILLIPGVEATIEGKHVLLINYLGPLDFKRIEDLKRLKDQPVLVIGAHPFFPGSTTLKKKLIEHIHLFDAIEYCHFYLKSLNFNKKALEVALKFGKPMFGTSDTHMLSQMNHTYSMVEVGQKSTQDVIEAVKKGKVNVITHPLPVTLMSEVVVKLLMRGLFHDLIGKR